jgi:hypothetical protein
MTSAKRRDAGSSTTTLLMPRAATLDGFAAETAGRDGVSLHDLDPLTVVVVRTRNSMYRIIVSERTAVRVQGGEFFPDPTPAFLNGSSAGGSLLKIAWIGVGLCMEISAGGRRIVTSPVRTITTASGTGGGDHRCH